MATIVTEHRPPRFLGLRPLHWLMLAIIATALGYGGLALSEGVAVSYASVSEAKASARSVQVAGYLHHTNKGSYDQAGNWVFDIQGDDGEVLTVAYPKAKPANFEQAIQVFATGKYDPRQSRFVADNLLIKCPSKYQEQQAVGGVR